MGTSQVLKELAAQLSDSFTDSLVDQHLSSWRRSRIYDTTSVQKPKTPYYYQLQTLPGRSTSSCDTDDIITCMAGFLVSSICNCMEANSEKDQEQICHELCRQPGMRPGMMEAATQKRSGDMHGMVLLLQLLLLPRFIYGPPVY